MIFLNLMRDGVPKIEKVIGLALGTSYHRSIEEKELALRFGKEYEEYRKRTSFFIPLPPKSL